MEHLVILLVMEVCVILLMSDGTLFETVLLVSDRTLSDTVGDGSLCYTVGE